MASAGQWNWERMRPAWDPVALDAASPGLPQQGPGEGSASSRGFSGLCQTPPCLPPPRWLARSLPGIPAGLRPFFLWCGPGEAPPLPSIGRWRRPWGDGEGTGPDPQQLVPDLGCQSSSWRQGAGTLRAKCRQAGVLSLEGRTGAGGGDWPPRTWSGAPGLPLTSFEACLGDLCEGGDMRWV